MIECSNASKVASEVNEEYVDVKKYIGVASVKVLCVNPSNAKLRSFGWSVAENAEEPKYVIRNEMGQVTSARVCFLVQIQDLPEKPIIPLNFWIKPGYQFTNDEKRVMIIDRYGRWAYGNVNDEVKLHKIPIGSKGTPVQISPDYKPCHSGEWEIVSFLLKHLNVTPLQTKKNGEWVATLNPGSLVIDDWKKICEGNVKEIEGYIAHQPENMSKVVLGVRTKDNNKTYQTFLPNTFIGNGARPDVTPGKYSKAATGITKFAASHPNTYMQYVFEAGPVREWKEEATKVEEVPTSSVEDDLPF